MTQQYEAINRLSLRKTKTNLYELSLQRNSFMIKIKARFIFIRIKIEFNSLKHFNLILIFKKSLNNKLTMKYLITLM